MADITAIGPQVVKFNEVSKRLSHFVRHSVKKHVRMLEIVLRTNCGDEHFIMHFNMTFLRTQHTSSGVTVEQIKKEKPRCVKL